MNTPDRVRPAAMRYRRSGELFERACAIIPGGIHLSGKPLGPVGSAPMYLESGRGCLVRDVDGHEYIDFVMAFGPFLLGYAHEAVDRAGIEQLARGSLLSMNHPLHIRFIEKLLARFPWAEMGVFFRSGSEATTAALRIARRATGRRAVARSGYHGWHDWCLPLEPYVPSGLDAQVLEFRAEDPATLEQCFVLRSDIAAVIVAPEMVIPTRPAIFERLAQIARANGAVFIMDEVKTAFRIAPGSVQQRVEVFADLTTLSKALGNGWPVAAVLGRRDVMEHARGMHYSATYHGDTAAMAAAMAALDIMQATKVASHVEWLGQKLITGLNDIFRARGLAAKAYGEPLPPMPFARFEHEDEAHRTRQQAAFYEGVFARGVLLHPRHLWFISLAHTEEDIARTLDVCDAAAVEAASL